MLGKDLQQYCNRFLCFISLLGALYIWTSKTFENFISVSGTGPFSLNNFSLFNYMLIFPQAPVTYVNSYVQLITCLHLGSIDDKTPLLYNKIKYVRCIVKYSAGSSDRLFQIERKHEKRVFLIWKMPYIIELMPRIRRYLDCGCFGKHPKQEFDS